MDRLWIGLSLLAIFAIGFIKIFSAFGRSATKIKFLKEYKNNFAAVANSYIDGRLNDKLCAWLTLNAVKAQRLVGSLGTGNYSAAFRAYSVTNYQFILNILPKFRSGERLHQSEMTHVEDILMMAIGEHEETVDLFRKELKNPFKWFQYGVRFIISLPIQILSWFGIISERTFFKITASGIFKFFAGIGALVGFVSAIVGLITGWDAFLVIVNDSIGKFFP